MVANRESVLRTSSTSPRDAAERFAAYIVGIEFCAAPTAQKLFCITAKGTSHSGPADVDGAPPTVIDCFYKLFLSFIVSLDISSGKRKVAVLCIRVLGTALTI